VDYPYEFGIGTAIGPSSIPSYLFDLDVKAPRQTFIPSQEYKELGNGDVIGRGYSEIEWYFEYLSDEETIVLRSYCPTGSGLVYVRTPDEDLNWHTYYARMIWPTSPPDVDNDYRMKVEIKFIILEQID